MATGGALSLLGRTGEAEARTVTGICRLCVMRCGIAAEVRGDRLSHVRGDLASKTRGFVCLHGHHLDDVVHSNRRLRAPLVRSRSGKLEPTSWDEALGVVAQGLLEVKDKHGARAVALQTGWPFVRNPLVPFLHRFCQAFGTPNLATVASLCEAAGRMGRALTTGDNCWPDVRRSRTLIVWGANPTVTAPTFAQIVRAMRRPGHNLIVVDPVRTHLADGATMHLQLRPGTDGALALAMMAVIVEEDLHDRAFIDAHTLGFEELQALLAEWPADRGAAVTGVPAEQLRAAARTFAKQGPASVWEGLGLEHHGGGVQAVRAVTCLQAIAGHLDVPGGATLRKPPTAEHAKAPLLPVLYRMGTPKPVPPPVAARPIGYDAHPLYEVFNRQAQATLFNRAILEDKPYPLRALVAIGSNPALTSPDSARTLEALDRLDLLVCVDPFLSATGQLADVVLPAATFVEGEPGDGPDGASARSPMLLARHDSRTEWDIVRGLADALGLGQYFPWATLAQARKATRWPYMIDEDPARNPRPAWDGGAPPRFPSVSGKVELSSPLLDRFGYSPVPGWAPPLQAPDAKHPLLLVSGPRTRAYINSQFRQIPSISAKGPEALVQAHPETARAAGVINGQRVAVVSPKGRMTARLAVTDRVRPDTVVVPAGWAGAANANRLTTGDAGSLDPISGFPALRSATCRIEPV